MEIKDWAAQLLAADSIEGKLCNPGLLTDHNPGRAVRWKEPARPPGMQMQKRSKKDKLPAFHEHNDPDKRAVCLHRFAGHELLAIEIMAYALLAFPQAPQSFRKGLAHTLRDEQRHLKLYIDLMKCMGLNFGDLPLYRHFWVHTPKMVSPIQYVSTMSLTLEMANLDFAPMYGQSFLRNGDHQSSDLMAQILKDEISHVGFGLRWLKKFKPQTLSDWDAWKQSISSFMTPKRAKGFILHEEYRLAAGIPQDWIDHLKNY